MTMFKCAGQRVVGKARIRFVNGRWEMDCWTGADGWPKVAVANCRFSEAAVYFESVLKHRDQRVAMGLNY